MTLSVLVIDLAKHIFQLHGGDRSEAVVLRKRLKRNQLLAFVQSLPPAPSLWRPVVVRISGGARRLPSAQGAPLSNNLWRELSQNPTSRTPDVWCPTAYRFRAMTMSFTLVSKTPSSRLSSSSDRGI